MTIVHAYVGKYGQSLSFKNSCDHIPWYKPGNMCDSCRKEIERKLEKLNELLK